MNSETIERLSARFLDQIDRLLDVQAARLEFEKLRDERMVAQFEHRKQNDEAKAIARAEKAAK